MEIAEPSFRATSNGTGVALCLPRKDDTRRLSQNTGVPSDVRCSFEDPLVERALPRGQLPSRCDSRNTYLWLQLKAILYMMRWTLAVDAAFEIFPLQ